MQILLEDNGNIVYTKLHVEVEHIQYLAYDESWNAFFEFHMEEWFCSNYI